MSESDAYKDVRSLTDREILEAIYVSQYRVEMMVTQTIAQIGPTLETFTKGGILGLMGRGR